MHMQVSTVISFRAAHLQSDCPKLDDAQAYKEKLAAIVG